VNVADALAAAAVLLMGEGKEQTPLAVLTDLPFVTFQDHNPSPAELAALKAARLGRHLPKAKPGAADDTE